MRSPSPGAVSRVVGYSTTDPKTTFVRGKHTLKNGSYYKRSWTSGSPYSSVPIWLDMDHCPPQQREFVVRPDLALTAMQRILSRIEKEDVMKATTKRIATRSAVGLALALMAFASLSFVPSPAAAQGVPTACAKRDALLSQLAHRYG